MFGRIIVIVLLAVVAWGVFARASSGAGPERTHVVKPGDTLWSIATARYDGDVREAVWRIEQRNGVRGLLRPGQRLVLP